MSFIKQTFIDVNSRRSNFEEKLNALTPKGWNNYLVVKRDDSGQEILSQANILRVLWERIKGKLHIFGGDGTKSSRLQKAAIIFFKEYKDVIDDSNLKKIEGLISRICLMTKSTEKINSFNKKTDDIKKELINSQSLKEAEKAKTKKFVVLDLKKFQEHEKENLPSLSAVFTSPDELSVISSDDNLQNGK